MRNNQKQAAKFVYQVLLDLHVMSTSALQEAMLRRKPKTSVASLYGGLPKCPVLCLLHTLSHLILIAEQFIVLHTYGDTEALGS